MKSKKRYFEKPQDKSDATEIDRITTNSDGVKHSHSVLDSQPPLSTARNPGLILQINDEW